MLKIIMFLRELNWLTISSLLAALLGLIVASIPSATSPAPTISLVGLSISLALLALRD
jgi:hypothetical protein